MFDKLFDADMTWKQIFPTIICTLVIILVKNHSYHIGTWWLPTWHDLYEFSIKVPFWRMLGSYCEFSMYENGILYPNTMWNNAQNNANFVKSLAKWLLLLTIMVSTLTVWYDFNDTIPWSLRVNKHDIKKCYTTLCRFNFLKLRS